MPVSTKADAACLCGAVLPDQTGLPVLSDAGWLAGAKSEVAWGRGEQGGVVSAEEQLTTASRATANLGLRLHPGSPQVLCSPPRSSVRS